MKKPALWWGRSGVWVSMGLRWVFGGLQVNLQIIIAFRYNLFAIFLNLQMLG